MLRSLESVSFQEPFWTHPIASPSFLFTENRGNYAFDSKCFAICAYKAREIYIKNINEDATNYLIIGPASVLIMINEYDSSSTINTGALGGGHDFSPNMFAYPATPRSSTAQHQPAVNQSGLVPQY